MFIKNFILRILASFFLAHACLAMKRSHEDERPISFIPYEVFVKIIYQLNFSDWQTVSLVCKKWQDLINEDLFWYPLIEPEFGPIKYYLLSQNRSAKEVYFNHQYSLEMLSIKDWPTAKLEKLAYLFYEKNRQKLLHDLEHVLLRKAQQLKINDASKLAAFFLSFCLIHPSDISKSFPDFSALIADKTCRYLGHAVRRKTCNIPSCPKQQILNQMNQKIAASINSDDIQINQWLSEASKALIEEKNYEFKNFNRQINDSIKQTMDRLLNKLFCDDPLHRDLFAIFVARISYLYGFFMLGQEILHGENFDEAFRFILEKSHLFYDSPRDVIKIIAQEEMALKNAYYFSVKNVMDYLSDKIVVK